MTMLSIWPTLAILGITILILTPNRIFRFLDSSPNAHQHRRNSIDGLRGILASGVFFHHFIWMGYDLKNRVSGLPPSDFYASVGPNAVSVFFMITAYLFWGRLIDKKGLIPWREFFVNRIFRIAPLYLFLIAIYFAFVISKVGIPDQSITVTATQTFKWLALGAVDQPTPFLSHPEFLGIVGQTWSLHYEWMFYLCLPLLAVVNREKSSVAVIGATLLFVLFGPNIINQPYRSFVENFLIGMLVASLVRAFPALRHDGPVRSMCAIAAAAAALMITGEPFTDTRSILLGLFFFFVASGASMFGLLLTAGARRLGNISYSIYLLHGIVIVSLREFHRYNDHIAHSDERFWIVTSLTYIVVVALSMTTYQLIERRGIELGRRAAKGWIREPELAPSLPPSSPHRSQ